MAVEAQLVGTMIVGAMVVGEMVVGTMIVGQEARDWLGCLPPVATLKSEGACCSVELRLPYCLL